jgi:hypothetical protein
LNLPILPGATQVVLGFNTPVAAQAVKVKVVGEDGSVNWAGLVVGTVKTTIDHPTGAYLHVTVGKIPGRVLQDFHLQAIEGVLPLAAPDPAWLFQP